MEAATGAGEAEEADRRVIVHVLAPAPFGGLERVVLDLASGQRSRGHSVHVAAVVGAGEAEHPFVRSAAETGAEVHVLEVPARRYDREVEAVSRLVGRTGPDVVHTHGYRADVVSSRGARAHGVATVSTVHGFTRNGQKNRTYEWLQKRSYRRFDAVVAVSRPQVGELVAAGAPAARVHCIPNGWMGAGTAPDRGVARRRLDLPPDAFVIGWVGRIEPEKGPDVLVDACGRFLSEARDCVVVVVGDGRLRPDLERRTAAAEPGAVRWVGAVEDARALFGAFDLFVLSSRTEGTPMVLLEAMAAGVPVVATRVGGVPDVVTEREAWLVPSGDAVALAVAMRDAVSDSNARLARAAAAAERLADVFDPLKWLDRYDAVYRSVVRNETRRRS